MAKFSKPIVWGSAICTVLGGAVIFRDFLTKGKFELDGDLDGKTIIVTGANSGIGEAVVADFAKRKARVIMACRDMEKCEAARRNIVLESRNKYVYCRPCNLASQESIREFVKRFLKENSQLHILVNNAGVMRHPEAHTKEGIEIHLGVNHMGHFLLTNLLLDVLKSSAPSKIINVVCPGYKSGKIRVNDLNYAEDYDNGKAFCQSQLAKVLFTKELAEKLKGTNVTVNAVSPGVTWTNITRHLEWYNGYIGLIFIKPFVWPFTKSAAKGAQPIINVAMHPELTKATGRFYEVYKEEELVDLAKNNDLAKWMWLVSDKWTKMNTA